MKIFEVAGVGKLHGLTVMSLDAFVKDDEKEVEEAVEGRQKHKVAVTVSDPNHPMVSKRGETRQRMCSVTADGREQACDTAVNWYKKQGYRVHDHNYVGTVEDTVKEGVMSDLHLQFADVYDELAPGIEKHKDSVKAGQLYDALKLVAEKNGAVSEFKRMMMSARNSAHQDYDTNPGGFENWFWYLPFGDELGESINPGVAEGKYHDPESQSIKSKPTPGVMYTARPDEDGVHYPDYGNTNKPPRKFRVTYNDGSKTTDTRYRVDPKTKKLIPLHRISIENESVNLDVAEDRESIPSGKKRITWNGIDLVVSIDGATVDIRAMTGDSQMAYVVFDRDGDTLVADDLAVEEQYKGQGIAKIMYDYVKELGFRVKRSSDQLVAGKKFWDKNKGAENNIWEQGVPEGGMPSSVINSKQRYGDMSDKDFAELHQSKADDDLVAMAWRHGYGKGSLHYVNKRKRGKEGVAEGSLNEFAVDSSGGGEDDEYDLLFKLVKMWWTGNEQQHFKAEKTLASMGISIEENEPDIILHRGNQFLKFQMDDFEQGVAENTAAGINKMFNNLYDPVYSNLQRVALLAMQGRQQEAAGRLQTVIKDADPAVQKKITDAVNNIKPVTINGRVADSSTLDKSKQHNDWITNTFIPWVQSLLGKQGVAEGGEKYKVKSIGHDAKGDYYISPSTGKKVYKSGVKRGDHENPNTGEIKKNIAEAPGDFGLGANYRAVPDAEMQDLMGRSKNKTKTKRDKFDYPYIHGSNIQVKDEGGKTFDAEALKKSIMVRPGRILGQNAKMQHSETGTEAIFDIGLPALKGLAVNEKTGEFVVVDTCPGAGACKTFCYAMKGSYVMFKAVSMGLARMLNFLLNDPTGFASQLNAEIAAAKSKMAKKNAKVVVRWHDAGDFFSAEYLDMAYGVANANPDVGFYAYTKMADVATGQRPKNFNMNFSGGAVSSQEKKIDFQRVKHSKVVPKDMFFDLIARDGTSLKKDAKGRMQFASPENLDQFKSIMAQKYAIDKNSILTYDEMMKTPVGDKPKWNTIVMPGDGDNSANRNDVVGSYLLFH